MYAASIIAPASAFLLVILGTYSLFRSLGLCSASLLFTRTEARAFKQKVSKAVPFLVLFNIFGTLTSLATVYIFFIGTAKAFGYFIYAAPVTIALSFVSTNWLTKRVLKNNPAYNKLLQDSETTAGVVARLVWGDSREQKLTAWIIKYLSLLNILAIIWLEFSVGADLFALQFGAKFDPTLIGASATFGLSVALFLLILSYGMRGYIFADMFLSPLVVLGTLVVLLGLGWHVSHSEGRAVLTHAWTPKIPLWQGVLFIGNVFAANFFFVLVTETHWLRIWIFKDEEKKRQGFGTIWAGIVWTLLATAGCLAGLITAKTGTQGVVPIIMVLGQLHPILAFLFWLGAAAALCSVADAQIYAFLLVYGFRVSDGKIRESLCRPRQPLFPSIIIGIAFSALYFGVRRYSVPFEKIIFILLPVCLNALPAFLAVATRRRIYVGWTVLALVAYVAASTEGLMQPATELAWSLTAALMPIGASLLMLAVQRQAPTGESK